MKKMRMTLLSLMAGALITGAAGVDDANAGVRVKATVTTPNVHIRVGNVHSSHNRRYKRGYKPIRFDKHVNQRERKIARRLSGYTGVPARKLVRLHRHGYSWMQIGRFLELRRPVIRAAMTAKSWRRFLRRQTRFARCGTDAYNQRVFAYGSVNDIDLDFEYEDDDD